MSHHIFMYSNKGILTAGCNNQTAFTLSPPLLLEQTMRFILATYIDDKFSPTNVTTYFIYIHSIFSDNGWV